MASQLQQSSVRLSVESNRCKVEMQVCDHGPSLNQSIFQHCLDIPTRSRLFASRVVAPAVNMGITLFLAAALFVAPCMAQYVDAPTPDEFVSEYGTAAYAYQPSLNNNTATTVKICE